MLRLMHDELQQARREFKVMNSEIAPDEEHGNTSFSREWYPALKLRISASLNIEGFGVHVVQFEAAEIYKLNMDHV